MNIICIRNFFLIVNQKIGFFSYLQTKIPMLYCFQEFIQKRKKNMHLSYVEIWKGIDQLAYTKKMSLSAMAQKAGLDPTAFNKSKRVGPDGRKRWLSMESLNKVLNATNTTLDEFIRLTGQNIEPSRQTIPLLGFAQAGCDGFFDDAGFPIGSAGWDAISCPMSLDKTAYALEVCGSSMEPVYREGDRLIVSPDSEIRKGDRIVLKTKNGEVMVKELKRQTASFVELKSLNPAHPDRSFPIQEISWMARVLWVSQ